MLYERRNGWKVKPEERDGVWECDVIAPDGTVVDTIEPVDGVGSIEDALINGIWRAADLAEEQGQSGDMA